MLRRVTDATWGDLQGHCDRLIRSLVVYSHEHHLFYASDGPDIDGPVTLVIRLAELADEIGRQFPAARPCGELRLIGTLTTWELAVTQALRSASKLDTTDSTTLIREVTMVRKSITR